MENVIFRILASVFISVGIVMIHWDIVFYGAGFLSCGLYFMMMESKHDS